MQEEVRELMHDTARAPPVTRRRSVFDRYNIVSEDDLAAAADRVTAYVATATTTPALVAPLGREHTRNAHTDEPRSAAGSAQLRVISDGQGRS